MDSIDKKYVPEIITKLKADFIQAPNVISKCSGIRLYGRRIKSIIFTTDIAIIANTNADAILAVFPFTPQPSIFESIANVAASPFFAGVGGGTTRGERSARMASFAESYGAYGVVLNAPTKKTTVDAVRKSVDCPIISTIVSKNMDVASRLQAGVNIINVSGGEHTPEIVSHFRKQFPSLPIIATGGPTEETILSAIEAGANAITFTPPANGEIFRDKMEKYRQTNRDTFFDDEEE